MATNFGKMTLTTLDELECHFTWKPEENSTKSNVDDAIKKTSEKIDREPHKKAAHLATLAYLYTRKARVDYVKAQDTLEEALELDAQIRSNGQLDHQISSEFVIRADLLHLKQLRKGQNKPLKPHKIEAEMQRLNTLWSDLDSRARIFGVKGVTFDCFGPKKYAVGVKAFAEASKLQPDNFYWLHGEAFLRARCSRQVVRRHANRYELELWQRARQIGESKGLTTATFYANYAEAILYNERYVGLCGEMANKAVSLLLSLSTEAKQQSHIVYIICLKVFRLLQSKMDVSSSRKLLLEDAERVQRCNQNSALFLELANDANASGSREEAIRLLERGKELAGEPGHLWIELRLVELQAPDWGQRKVLAAYDSLRETFSNYDRNRAAFAFYKALYLLQQGEIKKAVKSCVVAFNDEPPLSQVWTSRKREFLGLLIRNRNGFEEYLAWFAENIGSFATNFDIESLFKEALRRDEQNEFALEHLGRFLMKNQRADEATQYFRKLSIEHSNRRKLLAESLLLDLKADLKMLEECLECGCRDAAPRMLDLLEKKKLSQQISDVVKAEVAFSQEDRSQMFFSTAVYDLCARIESTIQDSNSFSLVSQSEVELTHESELIRKRIAEFLELNQLTSKSSTTSRSDEVRDERGNLMRFNRLLMTKYHNNEDSESRVQELNMIVSVLKESKEVLDRSLAVRMKGTGREFAYPHAFNQIKKQLGGDYKKKFSQMSSESERKTFEVESLMKLLKESKDAASHEKDRKDAASYENVRKCMQEELKRIDINFHQSKDTRDLIEFMVSREHRILSSEDGWIVRWIYLVNSEKHGTEILVNELNEQLRSDWSGGGECRRTAYDVAHLAAEFAEETWAVFSSGVGSGQPKSSAAGEAAGVGADEGASQESNSEKPEMLSGPTRED